MIGYNLYVEFEDGGVHSLYLSYSTLAEANKNKEILEQVYGKDSIIVDCNSYTPSITE